MDTARTQHQLGMIADVVAMSGELGIQLWLRGGWAMDFFLGQVTRDHVDIDWFGWINDAPALEAALHADGYRTIPGPPPDQQLDVTKDNEELGFAWLARGAHGQVTVAGGQFAGEAWPDGMLDWPPGRIGELQVPIMSPYAQIETKEMMPVWVPGRPRRAKDAEDVARLREALESRRGQPGQAQVAQRRKP
jgi:hypothetical protein